MTRKHFEAVASALNLSVAQANRLHDGVAKDTLYVVACDLAATFSTFNSNFNRTRFLTACGF